MHESIFKITFQNKSSLNYLKKKRKKENYRGLTEILASTTLE